MLLCRRRPAIAPLVSRALRHSSGHSSHASDEDIKQARAWLKDFHANTVPENILDFSFSRSSGPGGQNVNKVNSKATLKVSLTTLQSIIPRMIWNGVAQSRYATSKQDLVIQADDSRKQTDNMQSCRKKLSDLIMQAGREAVPGETSDTQKNRVKNLQKSANEGRLRDKKFSSAKKAGRRASGNPDY